MWIEILLEIMGGAVAEVTPFAGVWIEIGLLKMCWMCSSVTPFAGVWIEIASGSLSYGSDWVTPFAGVWIEIAVITGSAETVGGSPPSRGCGLKFVCSPLAGAMAGHPLRGGVD